MSPFQSGVLGGASLSVYVRPMNDLSNLQLRQSPPLANQIADGLGQVFNGLATYRALLCAIQDFSSASPDDCDVLIQVDDVLITKVTFFEPHTFTFDGIDKDGHRARIIIHFSQLKARVVYRPKRDTSRIITEMEIVRDRLV